MVLFKRKPVQYLPQPRIEDHNAEVWVIGHTGEIFTNYESYLARMDFYKQKRFICEITGHSALTFFEALKSEMENSIDVDKLFPDPLKAPVLRKVQFSTVSRIDTLVDHIYESFKEDFYPGEQVTVMITHGEKLTGIIRDKTLFNNLQNPDGTTRSFQRYFVSLTEQPDQEALVDEKHLFRDRKTFTKAILRSFIKNTVTREAWAGAPWLVKEHIAEKYRIDTNVPPHLTYANHVAGKKANLAQRRDDPSNVTVVNGLSQALPELRPKSHKSKQEQAIGKNNKSRDHILGPLAMTSSNQSNGNPSLINNFNNNFPPFASMPKASPIPAPPVIKYPVEEDLEVPPRREIPPRPALKFISQDTPISSKFAKNVGGNGILMESVGPLLETWNTLNVYCEVFRLDSFTFEDFVEALQFSSDDVECELLNEIHCAVLKILIEEDGTIAVRMPELPEEDESDEEDSSIAVSVIPTPEPEVVKVAGRRTTRSSIAKVEIVQEVSEPHRAVQMLSEVSWMERVKKNDFKYGGWEVIVVGVLQHLSLDPKQKDFCEQMLEKLAPADEEPTRETARIQYQKLDINSRVKILQILCMLTVDARATRDYMEECQEQMTQLRKVKIEWQRAKRLATEELRQFEEERKILLPENLPALAEVQVQVDAAGDVKMDGVDAEEEEEAEIPDSDSEEPRTARSLRRGGDRAADRKRKREHEREKKEKAEAAAKMPKVSKQFKKVLAEIEARKKRIKECEREILTQDNDLREADCFRTKVLGKDRFHNRYYWFERNGMPYAGLPTSSTADAGYANGCLWVQGPDEMERNGFIDLPDDECRIYQKKFKMTVEERKKTEEGSTSLFNASQWGYFDDPESIKLLLSWLDIRGMKERQLHKELLSLQDRIIRYMEARKTFLDSINEKKPSEEPTTRMSTRTKVYVDPVSHHCLGWRNTTALNELGYLHSDGPRPSRKATKKADLERVTRSGQPGKLPSRQGTRYNF